MIIECGVIFGIWAIHWLSFYFSAAARSRREHNKKVHFCPRNQEEIAMISTFVIFDIETTGLPRYEGNRTKITELTFLAVARRDIVTAINGPVPLINKLSYLFNPERKIQSEASKLTGLTNALLQNQQIFKSKIRSIISFLEDLLKPVCLVAHNGNSFDYKILQSEFIDAGEILPKDLLCVDSLSFFRKVLKETNLCLKILPAVDLAANVSKPDDDLLTDDEDWPDFNTTAEEWAEIDILVEKFSTMSPHEDNRSKMSTDVVKSNNGCIKVDKTTSIFKKKAKVENVSCTLQVLYERLLNKEPVNAHRSEGDCIMLLECIAALKDKFLPYADEKCKLISAIKPFQRK